MSGLFRRISSVLSAAAHDTLDSVESPDAKIRQLVRESSDNITRVRTLAIEAVASEKSLGTRLTSHRQQASEWNETARSAMEKGDEDQARLALARKIEQEKFLAALEPQHETALSNSANLKVRLKELESSLNDLKSKQAGLVARQKGAEAIEKSSKVARDMRSRSDIDENVSRAEELVADLEARNAATAEIDSATHPEFDLEAQRATDQLERELDTLRNAR